MARTGTAASHAETAPEEENGEAEGRLLDGFLLLAAGGSIVPEDVVSVNLSSTQIAAVAEQDLTFFTHIDRLDVSDNRLSHEHILSQFNYLPRLGVLSLACNSISLLTTNPGPDTLRHLHTLDLSFNGLHGEVLAQLANLPKLITLNLSSNCISLVPSESEICGLQSLEDLSLDNNDLVQFVQWRALDALPRLRKLSLASNRIKRLTDDVLDSGIEVFRSLEELDLSSNEIVHVSKLPAVHCFRHLNTLRLSNNPCMRGSNAEAQSIKGVKIFAQQTKAWYLCGGGCFQVQTKATEPRVKMNRKKMRKVSSVPVFGDKPRHKCMTHISIYDEEASQLLLNLEAQADGKSAWAADVTSPQASPPDAIVATGVLSEDLSEEELAEIFRKRREKIDRIFHSPVEDPPSFMKQTPFPVSASDLANRRLAQMQGKDEEEDDVVSPLPTSHLSSQASVAPRTKPSVLFALTSIDDGGAANDLINSTLSSRKQPPVAASPVPSQPNTPSPVPGVVPLPPIGGVRAPPPVPDIGVREAMRALRAAAMSDYASGI